jgi:hypothetical protein
MQLSIVDSAALAGIAYDARRGLLQLQFRDQATYSYFGVPVAVHDALLRAPSQGEYFNRAIRGQFACARISLESKESETASLS